MTAAASPLSFAATGLGAFSKVDQGFVNAGNQRQQGEQTAQMDEFRAQQLMDASEFGKAQAAQVDAFSRSKLMTAIGHMMAVGASANVDASSPTNAAIAARTQGQGDQERAIKVGDLNAQAAESASEAGQYTNAAQQTLNAAFANSGNDIFGGLLGGAQNILQGLSGITFTGNTSLPNNKNGGLIGFG